MDEGHPKNCTHKFSTLDAYLSAFLCIQGFAPDLIQEGPRVVFTFTSSPSLLETIAKYNAGALVSASQFALATKALKSQIHSMRRDKGNSYGTAKPHPR